MGTLKIWWSNFGYRLFPTHGRHLNMVAGEWEKIWAHTQNQLARCEIDRDVARDQLAVGNQSEYTMSDSDEG